MGLYRSISGILLLVTIAGSAFGQNAFIKAGHVFDSRTGTMSGPQNIIVKKGRISEIGAGLNNRENLPLVDLSDSYVLPGLMDCHVHLTANYPYRQYNGLDGIYTKESNAFRALRGANNAGIFLRSGFTTVKEIGNDAEYATADLIRAAREGWIKTPTIFYAGKIIAPYGGQTNDIPSSSAGLWNLEYIDADTPDEIVKAIRKNIYNGANCIKLVTGDQRYFYSEADIRTAVTEAHRAGVKLTAHVFNGEAARNVIMGGADAIEHGLYLEDDLLKLMKEKGTFLVGTDLTFDNIYAYGGDSLSAKRFTDPIIDRLRRAYKIGVKMAFGTDVIIDLPGKNRVESNMEILRSWKAAGIPPSYLLQTMTIYAAELLGIEKNRGVLEKNYIADIIAVRSDPITDMDAIKKVNFVMKSGEIIVNDNR